MGEHGHGIVQGSDAADTACYPLSMCRSIVRDWQANGEGFGLLAQQLDAVFVQVLPFDDLNNNK